MMSVVVKLGGQRATSQGDGYQYARNVQAEAAETVEMMRHRLDASTDHFGAVHLRHQVSAGY